MSKFQEFKTAMKNTPPDRLAKIEYQSHFLQMVGVSIVCGILIYRGFWYIIFAFIFSLGISYSQGISALQKYKAIKEIVGETYDPKKDKSPSRKRTYLIKKTLGGVWLSWLLIISITIIHIIYFPRDAWWLKTLFAFSILFWYIVIYFWPLYWTAKFMGGEK